MAFTDGCIALHGSGPAQGSWLRMMDQPRLSQLRGVGSSGRLPWLWPGLLHRKERQKEARGKRKRKERKKEAGKKETREARKIERTEEASRPRSKKVWVVGTVGLVAQHTPTHRNATPLARCPTALACCACLLGYLPPFAAAASSSASFPLLLMLLRACSSKMNNHSRTKAGRQRAWSFTFSVSSFVSLAQT